VVHFLKDISAFNFPDFRVFVKICQQEVLSRKNGASRKHHKIN
jgi:hypothetical protein